MTVLIIVFLAIIIAIFLSIAYLDFLPEDFTIHREEWKLRVDSAKYHVINHMDPNFYRLLTEDEKSIEAVWLLRDAEQYDRNKNYYKSWAVRYKL